MGKQFRFIMDESDEKDFFNYVVRTGKVFQTNKSEGTFQIFSILDELWLKLYLTKDEFDNLSYINSKDGVQYIDTLKSPVIEFRQTLPRYHNKEIQRGRIYFDNRYYDEEGNIVQKEKTLDNWYKELVGWLKKRLKCVEISSNDKAMKEYVSESLVELIKDGFKLLG